MAKKIQYLDLEGLKTLYGVVDSKITERINSLDKADSVVDGEFVTGVSEEDGIITVSRTAVASDKVTAVAVGAGSDTVAIDGTTVDEQIKSLGKSLKAEESARETAINNLDLAEVGGTGKFVQSVSQSDGKVTAVAAELNAAAVAATAIEGDDSTVAVAGTTVAQQIQSLGQTLKTVEGNAAKYKVVKLSDEEVKGLSDGANVREAYKVVSYVGADPGSDGYTQVGEIIKIYKDAALLSVTPEDGVAGENTVIKFTYSLADGTQREVSVDLGQAIFESEMGNGMQVADHKIAIKLDATNENAFLTVGADGLKLSGVQNAIDTAVANKNVSAVGDEYIGATAANNKVTVSADVQPLTVATTPGKDSTISGVEKSLVDGKEVADKVASFTNARIGEEIAKLDATVGEAAVAADKHVAVQVVETDGKITAVNVKESDIASKKGLDAEIARATAAEDKIEASVGLAADGSHVTTTGNYTKEATTVVGEIAALDAQLKIISDMSGNINETTQTITLGGNALQFIALTGDEIRSAWAEKKA